LFRPASPLGLNTVGSPTGWEARISSSMATRNARSFPSTGVRDRAYQRLREDTQRQGNGALAHINFSQMFETEANKQKQYLARHIVIATVIDRARAQPLAADFQMVVDMHAGKTPLIGTKSHHQSYNTNEEEGAI
jgi:hypothetical protein